MEALFDPTKYTEQQAQSLVNIPGQSLANTNPAEQIKNVQDNPGVITFSSLSPTRPLPITDPNPSPIPAVPDVTPLQPTEQEGKASSLIKKLVTQNDSLVGKSAYQQEQETKYGVPAAQANINDLTAQLTALKNEAAAIPLQLQQQAAGKAITNTVLGAQENARLRTNAIAALGVSTLLAASQGQLANAQAMADRAVKAKYDPIEEQIQANKDNLQLIIDSPETTLQEKNRALQQQALQDAKAEVTATKKADSTTIQKWAIEAIANGAPTLDAQAIMQIAHSSNPDLEKAFEIYSRYAKDTAKDTQIIQLADGRDVLIDKQTGSIIKTIGGATSTGGIGSGDGSTGGTGNGTIGTNGKPLTAAQLTAKGYYDRTIEADKIVSELGSKFTGVMSYIAQYAPNAIKSADRQRYEQAQRDFINAVLRPESGAAISDSEFDSAAKQYFPRPGDSKSVVDQKARNRQTKIKSLGLQAGQASTTETPTDLRTKYQY